MFEFLQRTKNKWYGAYPCNDYLNSAIRCILQGKTEIALSEICWCIWSAQGFVEQGLLKELEEKNVKGIPQIEKTKEGLKSCPYLGGE